MGSAVLAMAALLAACGGSSSDSNQKPGNYEVKVTGASFPTKQFVGQTSLLKIDACNTSNKTVPDLTVTVNITDQAQIANETQRSRANTEDSAVTNFFGDKTLPPINLTLPGTLLNANSTASSDGKGSVNRQETLQTNIAAVVTQVLPNGNLVVEGKQEIRVNTEIRELIVGGIVRPEDIQSDNLIDSSKIAEARIAYGGRGQISDVQQPRYGQQVFDVLLPF